MGVRKWFLQIIQWNGAVDVPRGEWNNFLRYTQGSGAGPQPWAIVGCLAGASAFAAAPAGQTEGRALIYELNGVGSA